MEQLDTATGTASHTKEPLVTDIGCVRLPAPLYGSYRYRGRMVRFCATGPFSGYWIESLGGSFGPSKKPFVSGCQSWMSQTRLGI